MEFSFFLFLNCDAFVWEFRALSLPIIKMVRSVPVIDHWFAIGTRSTKENVYIYRLQFNFVFRCFRWKKPPKKTFFKYTEEDLLKCLDEISKGAKIRPTCRKYQIPHPTVINKLKMRHLHSVKWDHQLSWPHKKNCYWLGGLTLTLKKGTFTGNSQIIGEDGRKNPFNSGIPGRKSFNSFLSRHTDVTQRYAESINSAWSRVTEESLRKWHSDFRQFLIIEHAADVLDDPDRIINADESVSMFVLRQVWYWVLKEWPIYTKFKTRKKKSSGKVLPVLIIYPYEIILLK